MHPDANAIILPCRELVEPRENYSEKSAQEHPGPGLTLTFCVLLSFADTFKEISFNYIAWNQRQLRDVSSQKNFIEKLDRKAWLNEKFCIHIQISVKFVS